MALFKKFEFIPKISATERTALDAGVVWVEKDLFSGKPDFGALMKEALSATDRRRKGVHGWPRQPALRHGETLGNLAPSKNSR